MYMSVFDNDGGEERVNFRVVGKNSVIRDGD
jgi:hypothetical protein